MSGSDGMELKQPPGRVSSVMGSASETRLSSGALPWNSSPAIAAAPGIYFDDHCD